MTSTTHESGAYTPDKDIKLHSENAIKLEYLQAVPEPRGWRARVVQEHPPTTTRANNVAEADRVIVLLMQNGGAGGRSNALAILDFGGMADFAIDNDFRHWADPEASGDAVGIQGGRGQRGQVLHDPDVRGPLLPAHGQERPRERLRNGRRIDPARILPGSRRRQGLRGTRRQGRAGPCPGRRSTCASIVSCLRPLWRRWSGGRGLRWSSAAAARAGALAVPYQQVIAELVEHPQMRMTLEMCSVYAVAGGRLENDGKPLTLPEIPPLPGGETPRVIDIPELLTVPGHGHGVLDDEQRGHPGQGRSRSRTSDRNMWRGAKKSRHNIIYQGPERLHGLQAGHRFRRDLDLPRSDLRRLRAAGARTRQDERPRGAGRHAVGAGGRGLDRGRIEKIAKEFEAQIGATTIRRRRTPSRKSTPRSTRGRTNSSTRSSPMATPGATMVAVAEAVVAGR